MKIKDIRQYRTFYKEKVRRIPLPDRDEHFMGTFLWDENKQDKTFGWFDIYHGDKEGYGKSEEGIGNFLQSFLDMAKDGQAVYEFLQNAVDSGSSHFTMAWGKDSIDGNNYVLIANNGDMFDFDSVRSILNVGSSTKTANSQNIGKFGIGFKLAHRLVGKLNGLDELLSDDPSGPILFSWNNFELGQLARGESPEPYPIDFQPKGNDKFEIKDTSPWLFKILLTCFPALPENGHLNENLRLADGRPSLNPVFKKEEYQALCRWVSNYSDILNSDIYKQGALFFIKLGLGKENDLADINLAEGVKFSLAILQETSEKKAKHKKILETVQLNREEPIKKPRLNYLFFHVTKSENLNDYLFVRFGVQDKSELTQDQLVKLDKEADIEILFGFRNFNEIHDYFKGAPNFYLYFPLSEEVHNFNFVLHSNAFYKASSRTFLHKGTVGEDGINERLLKTIARRLKEELLKLYNSDNQEEKNKFLHLYASLLTSKESNVHERKWVKAPFIDELTLTLKSCIPVRSNFNVSEFTLAEGKINIKKTAIEIIPQALGLTELIWFYWGVDAPDDIRYSALEKLDVAVIDIFELLQNNGVSSYINQWLSNDDKRIETIFNELNLVLDQGKIKTEAFKQNLSDLKLFKFSNDEILNINEITEKQNQGYIILHNKLASVKEELLNSGLKITSIDLDNYNFHQNFSNQLSPDSQLRNQKILIKIFSDSLSQEAADKFHPEEKINVFRVFRDMIDEGQRIERLKELRLFSNQSGKCVAIKNILLKTDYRWLSPFLIKSSEQHVELDRYLLNTEDLVYENVIYPFWQEVGESIIKLPTLESDNIFEIIKEYYKRSSQAREEQLLLSEHGLVIYHNSLFKADHFFHNEFLAGIQESRYNLVQDTLAKKLNIHIADQSKLKYYNDIPFKLKSVESPFDFDELFLSHIDAVNLFIFSRNSSLNILETHNVSVDVNGIYKLVQGPAKNFYSTHEKIKSFISNHYSESLIELPLSLVEFNPLVIMQSEKLATYLIEKLNFEDPEEIIALTESLLGENLDTLTKLLDKFENINLDITWGKIKANSVYLKFIQRFINSGHDLLVKAQDKIVLNDGSEEFHLSSIDSANDDITIDHKIKIIKLSRALLLGFEDNNGIRKTIDFARVSIEKDILSSNDSRQLFKILDSGITDELVARFHDNLEDKQLANTHQLVMVLASDKIDRKDVSSYKVLDASAKWQNLIGNWIVPQITENCFYNPNYVLADNYSDLSACLQLSEDEVFQYCTSDGSQEEELEDFILQSFSFISGCSVKILNPECSNRELFSHLFNRWNLTSQTIRKEKRNQPWMDVLKFEPKLKIATGLRVKSEYLEESLEEWKKEDYNLKIVFLKAIGIQTEKSDISRLRNWFVGKSVDEITDSIVDNIPDIFLSNTLVGLAEGFEDEAKNTTLFEIGSKHQTILNRIIKKCLDNPTENLELRLPVHKNESIIYLGSESKVWPKYLSLSDYEIMLPQGKSLNLESLFDEIRVIVRDDSYNDFAERTYEKIEVNYVFVKNSIAIEHDEPFYRSWRDENHIQLMQSSGIKYNAIISNGERVFDIGTLIKGSYYVERDEVSSIIYYDQRLRWEDLVVLLHNDNETDLTSLINALIISRNRTLAAFYHTLTSSGRDEFDDEDSRRILENLMKRSIEEERSGIIEDIKSKTRYSYDWFENYIRYLLSFENIADTTSQKSITFQKILPYAINGIDSDRYFILEGANSLIPINIEAYEDFSISITLANHTKVKIIVEGVSKKGQDLLTYVPGGIDSTCRNNFQNAVNIRVFFSPVLDLVKRLYDAFVNENIITPWEDIKTSLPPIKFIYGPPGTGKTTNLCKLLNARYSTHPVFKSLILVPTNKAGDVLAMKLFYENPNLSVVRLGRPSDPELETLDPEVYQSSVNEIQMDGYNVVISTVHRFPYYQVANENGPNYKLFDKKIKWDYIIFDESSMISLPHMVFSLMAIKTSNPEAQIMIAGDPKQIPPVVDTTDKDLENLDMDDENIYKMFGINSFHPEEQRLVKRDIDLIENLNTQYRSVEPIGKLFSEFSYNNLLKHGRNFEEKPIKQLPESFLNELKKPVCFIDFPLDSETSVLAVKKLLYSSYHVYAGILTSELVKYLDKCNVENTVYSLGIICPYKAQAMLLNKLIISSGISEKIKVYCDTVHGFQGDECDIVIFLVNPNNHYYTGHKNCLLSKEYIYNVAISRAKDYLWIINPFKSIRNNPFIEKMKEINTLKDFEIVSSGTIEQKLFGSNDYIVKNSYLTGHDNINVFGQVEMKYFIKAGDTAIDIQLKK